MKFLKLRNFSYISFLVVISVVTLILINILQPQRTTPQIKSNLSVNPKVNYDSDSPEGVVSDFYSWYMECIEEHFRNRTGNRPREDCPYEKSIYVTQEMVENIKSRYGDPILCALDTPGKIKVDKADTIGEKSNVIVHGIFESSGDNPLNVELRIMDGKWKITNISCISS